MFSLEVRDMTAKDEYFVGCCSHVEESKEIDMAARRRVGWIRRKFEEGLRVKVALLDGLHAGFLYLMPIEISPWGPLGNDLLVISCLYVTLDKQRRGVGRALVRAAEDETKRWKAKGIVTTAYYHDFWFMPATFFEKMGFRVANRRGPTGILWRAYDPSAELPRFLERNYSFQPVEGKVVIDLFWSSICSTSEIEAQRVREVASEFGDAVILNEYASDKPAILREYQTPRGIFINGDEIYWGYGAPKEGIRTAIDRALE
jgi:GNAT superfamily N-acetyltransferase